MLSGSPTWSGSTCARCGGSDEPGDLLGVAALRQHVRLLLDEAPEVAALRELAHAVRPFRVGPGDRVPHDGEQLGVGELPLDPPGRLRVMEVLRRGFAGEGRRGLPWRVLPIAGIERQLGQPYLLEGERANNLLTDLQARSATLDTVMEIEDGVGVIKPVATAVPTMVYNIMDGISPRGENPTAQAISGGAAPNGAAPFAVRGTCTEAGRRTRRNWPRAISRLVAPRSALALTPLPPCGVP